MATPERRESVSKPTIDRQKTTPFLLRLFVRTGGFHKYSLLGVVLNLRLEEFESPDSLPVQDEAQIYTWYARTLRIRVDNIGKMSRFRN